MSSDPDRYPIEEKVVPLVYELNCLRVCPPCWSCEGHNDLQGEVSKLPRVWFHSRSIVYPRMIAERLASLKFKKSIKCDWGVTVIPWSGNGLHTTHSIEPCIAPQTSCNLGVLQEDLLTIASSLYEDIHRMAWSALREMGSAGTSSSTTPSE